MGTQRGTFCSCNLSTAGHIARARVAGSNVLDMTPKKNELASSYAGVFHVKSQGALDT